MNGSHPDFWPECRKADFLNQIEDRLRARDNSNFVEHLSWDEVALRLAKGASAILPIGAAAKEHGFHLPMNTDLVQAELLAARIAAQVDALIWPTVSYGYYPAFAEYAGSCSLSDETFVSVIEELTRALLGFGCKAVLVLDTGISTISSVERALSRLSGANALHLKIYDGPKYRAKAERLIQQVHGSHADELETSLMLALAPHLVEMNRAEASSLINCEAEGPLTPSDPSSPNYSQSGSFGDPTLATRTKGDILLVAMMDDLIEQVRHYFKLSARDENRKAAS